MTRIRTNRWLLSLLCLALVVSVLVGSVLVGSASAAEQPKPVTVTFYHTSDLHEHSKPLPRIAGFVAQQKKKDPNTLLLDSGDWCNKGDLTPLNTRGQAIVEMMAAMNYDAVIAGNHDFSFGGERLAELVDQYNLPLLAANCEWDPKTKPKHALRSRVFHLNGVTVGVIGTSPTFVGKEKGPNVKIQPIVQAVQPIIADLIDRVDIIVLMTHIGVPEDQKLAKQLPNVALILGGHHHRQFDKLNYDKPTDTVIQHSGAFGAKIGKVTLTWDGEKVTNRTAGLIKVGPSMPSDAKVQAIADRYFSKQ